jgi:hypothetical protein
MAPSMMNVNIPPSMPLGSNEVVFARAEIVVFMVENQKLFAIDLQSVFYNSTNSNIFKSFFEQFIFEISSC